MKRTAQTEVIEQAIGPDQKLLAYDPLHGGRLMKGEKDIPIPAVPAPQPEPVPAPVVNAPVLPVVADQPIPEAMTVELDAAPHS